MEERPDLRSDLLGLVGCWGVGETVEASLCPSFEVRAAAGVTAVGVLGNGLAVSAGGIQAHYLGLSRILGSMLVLCSMGRSCSSRLALSLRCWGLPAMSHHDKTKRGKCLVGLGKLQEVGGLGPLQTPALRFGVFRGPSEPPSVVSSGATEPHRVSSARRRFKRNKHDTVRAFTPRLFHIFCWRRPVRGSEGAPNLLILV